MPTCEAEFHGLFDISASGPHARSEMNFRMKEVGGKKYSYFSPSSPVKSM